MTERESDWVEGIVAVSRNDGSRIEIKAPEGTFGERFAARVHPTRRVQVRPVPDEKAVGSGNDVESGESPERDGPATVPPAPADLIAAAKDQEPKSIGTLIADEMSKLASGAAYRQTCEPLARDISDMEKEAHAEIARLLDETFAAASVPLTPPPMSGERLRAAIIDAADALESEATVMHNKVLNGQYTPDEQISASNAADDSDEKVELIRNWLDAALTTAITDTERLDWLAYDMDNSPLFDALGDFDVHSAAADLWTADREPTPDEERGLYRLAFRAAIDAAMQDAALSTALPNDHRISYAEWLREKAERETQAAVNLEGSAHHYRAIGRIVTAGYEDGRATLSRRDAAMCRALAEIVQKAERFQEANADVDILSSGEHAAFDDFTAICSELAAGFPDPSRGRAE